MPTEAMVAQVLVSKYADHLPLYRQSAAILRAYYGERHPAVASSEVAFT